MKMEQHACLANAAVRAPTRTCRFIGTRREVGIFGRDEGNDTFSCTHTADWRVEYSNRPAPHHTTEACHDHLVETLDAAAHHKVTAILGGQS